MKSKILPILPVSIVFTVGCINQQSKSLVREKTVEEGIAEENIAKETLVEELQPEVSNMTQNAISCIKEEGIRIPGVSSSTIRIGSQYVMYRRRHRNGKIIRRPEFHLLRKNN